MPREAIPPGTLDMLILQTLARDPQLHGFEIAEAIQTRSEDVLRVEEGSLYPALHRMEQEGWLRAEWGKTEKNREGRFYSITRQGRKQLTVEQESWLRLTEGVARVMRGTAGAEVS